MKKFLRFLIKALILIILLSFPFAAVFLATEKTPNQYNKTYLAEFNDKYNLLNSTNEKKIVFVGGSSLPFGLRSDLVEQEIPGYKVVNFGLYATLGTKFMMDMSKSNINEGDIVILSPELNSQTYSLYFNPTAVLQACDGFSFKYKYLSIGDNLKLAYNYDNFAREKLNYSRDNNAPDPIGIYRHDSFNSYGDIEVERKNNIMNNGVDSTMKITTTNELLNDEFISYVNSYIDYVRNRKAKIYFNFSPCNELAISSSKKTRDEFQGNLDLKIKCDLLSNLDDCIIDYRYFYDTNFHLNSSGAIFYTSLLINNFKMKLNMEVANKSSNGSNNEPTISIVVPNISGDNNSTYINTNIPTITQQTENTNKGQGITIPEPPKTEDEEVVEPIPAGDKTDFDKYNGEPNNDYVDYFNYRLVGSSYQITGIKQEYKNIEKVILPSTYNGMNITTIVSNSLYGCINLKEVYIGKTYKVFEENSFNGCISLGKIYLFETDGNKLSPASSGLLNGTSKSIKIYIPTGANYLSGYTWSNYASYFEYFTRVGE